MDGRRNINGERDGFWMDRCMHACMDIWVDGWVDGWVDA